MENIRPKTKYDHKVCKICKNKLKIESFRISKHGYISPYCMPCHRKIDNTHRVVTIPEYKYCKYCDQNLKNSFFYKQPTRKDGLASMCSMCYNLRKSKRTSIKLGYMPPDITCRENYDLDWTKCFVCGSNKRLSLEHNHKTGKVRGVACSPCNWIIGSIENNLFPKVCRSSTKGSK